KKVFGIMVSQFDVIAEKYHEVKNDSNMHTALHMYTMVSLLPYESLKGKTVLDLACGSGVYSRIAAELGAENVIGVDISSVMINIGKQIEEKTGGSKIQYIVKDVVDIGKLGEFDVVWASFLLSYAKNIDNLKQMIQVVYNNLKPVAGDSWPPDNEQLRKYGKANKLISTNEPQDGDKLIVTLYFNDGSE
ncbi:34187_t:CDS:2, partial [Racocetra persica]